MGGRGAKEPAGGDFTDQALEDIPQKVNDRAKLATEPASDCSSFTIMRKMVDLPAPLGPTSPAFSILYGGASKGESLPLRLE